MKINKNLTKLVLSIAIATTCSSIAFADGNAFTPLNFDDSASSTYSEPKATPVTPKAQSSSLLSKVMPAKTPATDAENGEIPIGNDNIQNAILELDNAQVGIRNDLLNYKAKYADVDAQYKLIKNERTMLSRQVKVTERRIRKIDQNKEGLRKNML